MPSHNFKTFIFSATEVVCGNCRTGRKKKQSPWWTDEVKEEVKHKKYLITKSTKDYKNYKDQRSEVKSVVLLTKQKSWEEFGDFMEKISEITRNYFIGY
jgi:hypothetical protein